MFDKYDPYERIAFWYCVMAAIVVPYCLLRAADLYWHWNLF